MSEFEDWDVEELMGLYEIIYKASSTHEAKGLSEKLDKLDQLYEFVMRMSKDKLRALSSKLADILVNKEKS